MDDKRNYPGQWQPVALVGSRKQPCLIQQALGTTGPGAVVVQSNHTDRAHVDRGRPVIGSTQPASPGDDNGPPPGPLSTLPPIHPTSPSLQHVSIALQGNARPPKTQPQETQNARQAPQSRLDTAFQRGRGSTTPKRVAYPTRGTRFTSTGKSHFARSFRGPRHPLLGTDHGTDHALEWATPGQPPELASCTLCKSHMRWPGLLIGCRCTRRARQANPPPESTLSMASQSWSDFIVDMGTSSRSHATASQPV
ncbi:hypothetical protein IAQ61_001436 [Plenodomus lingam]|uniref:uncharacterized protein n=1 Tax=Leptosphaeria maculans TaxID=5022 RepID=UPI00331B4F46|nr:hypothetical protein IAQ61_001436 [Plenodomus lingam]